MRRGAGVAGGLVWLTAGLVAAGPESWIPVRWDGGPLEVARRAEDKGLEREGVREALARWYEPATLELLEGTPFNCLLVSLSGGAGEEIEKQQRQLVRGYAARARARGLAVAGLVYGGEDSAGVAEAAVEAQVDGLVVEGEEAVEFAAEVEKALKARGSRAVVIPVAPGGAHRAAQWAVRAVEGVEPSVGKASEGATASATAGLWVDSNLWLVRSVRFSDGRRPVWVSHAPRAEAPGTYLKSIADAGAAGGRWIVALDDGMRVKLFGRDEAALAEWRGLGSYIRFFEEHGEWRRAEPYGNVGIILDLASATPEVGEEYLNLVARRHIPYRILDRAKLEAASFKGLRAVLVFELAPPTEGERKLLSEFAAGGGLIMSGRSWGGAPRDQSYTMVAVEQGEVAVYKDETPAPDAVARDIHDLMSESDLGVSVYNAPSVLSVVSTPEGGKGLLIQMVNYATAEAEGVSIWVTGRRAGARLYRPGEPPVELKARTSGGRTEVAAPKFAHYAAVLVE